MTVSLDLYSSSSGINTDYVFDHAGASSGVKGVIVFICDVSANATLTGATYGGTALTQATSSPLVKNSGEPARVTCGYLLSSVPQGTQEVSITHSASEARLVAVMTLLGDDDLAETDTLTVTSDSTAGPSGTLTLGGETAFCAVAGVSGKDNIGTVAPLSGWASQDEVDAGAEIGLCYTYNTIASADVTAGWTHTAGNDDATCFGIAVHDTAVGGGVTIPVLMNSYRQRNNLSFG